MDYLDTSAFVKLVLAESESRALRAALGPAAGLISSALLGVESRRAAMRYDHEAAARTERALTGVTLIPIDDTTIALAGGLRPAALRSLDAIHLATALSVREDLGRFFCYDVRLAGAATAAGLRLAAPG